MITVNKIEGSPETTPEIYYSVHSDDSFFYFFESAEEHQAFLNLLPTSPEVTPPSPIIEFLQNATSEEITEFKKLLGI